MIVITLVTTWLVRDMGMACTAFQMVTGILGSMREIFPMATGCICLPVAKSMKGSGTQGRSMVGVYTPLKQV